MSAQMASVMAKAAQSRRLLINLPPAAGVLSTPALFRPRQPSRRRGRVASGEDFVSFDMSAGPGGKLKTAMSTKDKAPVFFTAGGILKKAPHPNGAKLFLTWIVSKEQQTRNPALYSPRRDLPSPAGLPPLASPRFANGYRDFLGAG